MTCAATAAIVKEMVCEMGEDKKCCRRRGQSFPVQPSKIHVLLPMQPGILNCDSHRSY